MKKETKKVPKIVAKTIINNPVEDYNHPNLNKVATDIVADNPEFVPQQIGNEVELKAKMDRGVTLPHRGMVTVDCGFSMKLPVGYKAKFSPAPNLAAKGLVVATATYDNRVVVTVLNLGRELISVNHGDRFARMSIEPVYLVDWVFKSGFGPGRG